MFLFPLVAHVSQLLKNYRIPIFTATMAIKTNGEGEIMSKELSDYPF